MSATDAPSVAAIVLNWNNYEDTAECIDSLQPHIGADDRIILVDNGSTDGSVDRLRVDFPDLQYLVNDENLGFAGGMNCGIEWARREGYDTALLLNNDIIVDDETRIHDLAWTAMDPTVGLVTPVVREYPGDDVWFAKGTIDERWITFSHETDFDTQKRYLENDFVPLCCSMLSLSALESVGDLNEEYFLYCEDVELGDRLRNQGYSLLTDTRAIVRHKISGSSESSFSPVPAYYRTRNRHLFSRRRLNGRNPFAFAAYSMWWAVTRSAWALTTSGIDGALAVYRGELDGWREKWGKGPY